MERRRRYLFYCLSGFIDILRETIEILSLPAENLTRDILDIEQEC
jgi:hypothetical protein